MSKDWQIGSGYVKEPKVTGIVGKNKDGYGDAKVIEIPISIGCLINFIKKVS